MLVSMVAFICPVAVNGRPRVIFKLGQLLVKTWPPYQAVGHACDHDGEVLGLGVHFGITVS